jgi:CMP-N-acetylneuraminic acid synthetase
VKPLCVVPARRGSKRLAEKNLRPLAGRPMLAYTVAAAQASGVFERVFVSTEDAEIARLAEALGAVAHPRPDELAGDLVSATDVCLELAEAHAGEGYDAVVCLQPSSPLRAAADVRGAWERFSASGADYLVSVTSIDPHYFHWAVARNDAGWAMVFGDRYMLERPLLPPVFRPNGAIKIARLAPLAARRNFFGAPLEVYEMPEERSIHVAEALDHAWAEYLLSRAEVAPPTPPDAVSHTAPLAGALGGMHAGAHS